MERRTSEAPSTRCGWTSRRTPPSNFSRRCSRPARSATTRWTNRTRFGPSSAGSARRGTR
eukprot:31389-Pelagococcus_subviridis.AAC.8